MRTSAVGADPKRTRTRRTKAAPARGVTPAARPFGCPVDTLKIGPHLYALKFEPEVFCDGEPAYGTHDPATRTIALRTDLARPHLAEILLHEINHALWLLCHLHDAQGEESLCGRQATGLTSVEADNLPFFRWRLDLLDPAVPL